ncbi:transcriptional regulator swi6 [Blastocladiella emersonii ATCC 22665]|nr:transcriptional regulator swi6 [Blastocladiella emersonii ATCC 22665]
MTMGTGDVHSEIHSAVYSGVPVWEMITRSVAVMRRKSDSYLNATQLLKVAGIEKARRTKILERDVAKGVHEKVQGGYGKYQGTWIPFERGIEISRQYGILEFVQPIIDFDPATMSARPKPNASARNAAAAAAAAANPGMHGGAAAMNARAGSLLPMHGGHPSGHPGMHPHHHHHPHHPHHPHHYAHMYGDPSPPPGVPAGFAPTRVHPAHGPSAAMLAASAASGSHYSDRTSVLSDMSSSSCGGSASHFHHHHQQQHHHEPNPNAMAAAVAAAAAAAAASQGPPSNSGSLLFGQGHGSSGHFHSQHHQQQQQHHGGNLVEARRGSYPTMGHPHPHFASSQQQRKMSTGALFTRPSSAAPAIGGPFLSAAGVHSSPSAHSDVSSSAAAGAGMDFDVTAPAGPFRRSSVQFPLGGLPAPPAQHHHVPLAQSSNVVVHDESIYYDHGDDADSFGTPSPRLDTMTPAVHGGAGAGAASSGSATGGHGMDLHHYHHHRFEQQQHHGGVFMDGIDYTAGAGLYSPSAPSAAPSRVPLSSCLFYQGYGAAAANNPDTLAAAAAAIAGSNTMGGAGSTTSSATGSTSSSSSSSQDVMSMSSQQPSSLSCASSSQSRKPLRLNQQHFEYGYPSSGTGLTPSASTEGLPLVMAAAEGSASVGPQDGFYRTGGSASSSTMFGWNANMTGYSSATTPMSFNLKVAVVPRSQSTTGTRTPTSPMFMQVFQDEAGDGDDAAGSAARAQERSRNQWMAVFLAQDAGQAADLIAAADKCADVNLVIDDQGNTPLHWAAALARLPVLRELVARGADVCRANAAGETPLMRAVVGPNNYDAQTFPEVLVALADSLWQVDTRGRTVLHHLVHAMTMANMRGLAAAKYYLQTLSAYLVASHPADQVTMLVCLRDVDDHTAIDLAAHRDGAHDVLAALRALAGVPTGNTPVATPRPASSCVLPGSSSSDDMAVDMASLHGAAGRSVVGA